MAQYDSALVIKSKRNSRKFSDIDLNFTRNTITSDIINSDVSSTVIHGSSLTHFIPMPST